MTRHGRRRAGLGVAMPESVGGAGLGLTEAAIVMQTVSQSGAGFSGRLVDPPEYFRADALLVKLGTDAQRETLLPRIIAGEDKMCFGVTEPNSGLDTSSLQTKAERTNDGYLINGRKIWTTGGQRQQDPHHMRAPRRGVRPLPMQGLSSSIPTSTATYIDVPSRSSRWVAAQRRAWDTLFIDNLAGAGRRPDRRGGQGYLEYLLQGLNPGACAARGGRPWALDGPPSRARRLHANERVVFGRPIGQNEGVQHLLARLHGRSSRRPI